ncbi:MAG: hypothetical protein ACI4YB_01370 [Oscillospiraceae bacterium]
MPIKYVPFITEPVEGQAVLGNFNRILKYKGADDVSMTLQRGMPLYEMEKQETVGENVNGNMVIRGECVSACAYLKEQGIQVDLVYIVIWTTNMVGALSSQEHSSSLAA